MSWYLQNCRFYLRNLLAVGRSLDCFRHRHARLDFEEISEPLDDSQESELAGHEILELLWDRLNNQERRVLDELAVGVGSNEIGRRFGIPHSSVHKIRAKIRQAALRLGIEPLGNGSNGKK